MSVLLTEQNWLTGLSQEGFIYSTRAASYTDVGVVLMVEFLHFKHFFQNLLSLGGGLFVCFSLLHILVP